MESSNERAQALNGDRLRDKIARRRDALARGLTNVKHFGVQKVADADTSAHLGTYEESSRRDLASILASAAASEAANAAAAAEGDE